MLPALGHTTMIAMTEKDPLKSLIVAIDGSEGGNAAVAEAIALARGLPAALTFVFVRKPPSSLLGYPLPLHERHVSYDLRRARETIGVAIETATAAGIECDGEILEGDVADEIVSLADNRHADVIVVGSRGHGALAGALLGSVSRAVVQHAHVPVLVAKQRPVPRAKVA
jgi:nucleotide-binding universal stress UspA family protein